MKTLRKVLFYLLLIITVSITVLVVSVYLFKDQIIKEFIREANKSLNTPVKIGKTEVSVFHDFPNISIVFTDVYIEDSHPGQYPLLTASSISFQLNALDVWQGNYQVRGLKIFESETNLKVNQKGVTNFNIFKKVQKGDTSTVKFELKNVSLADSRVRYIDRSANQEHDFFSERLTASIYTANDIYSIEADGNVRTNKIKVGKNNYFLDKEFQLKTSMMYDDENKSLSLTPSQIKTGNAQFELQGSYTWKQKKQIDIACHSKKGDIQTLLSLLPSEFSKHIEKYQSRGEVYFNAEIKGEMSERKSPGISLEFGFTNTTIFHPDYNAQINNASLTGSFASKSLTELSTTALVLKEINGEFNKEKFTADLVVQNFSDPDVIFNFKGKLDVNSLLNFYPIENVSSPAGTITADISFEGNLALLKKRATAQQTSTRGSLILDSISMSYGKENIELKNISGTLQFNNNDLALSDVTGSIGKSDFKLNGFFKNIVTFLLFENQPIGIETDLSSQHLELDELFALGFASQQPSEDYHFTISKNLYLNFNCDVKSLNYKRFKAHEIMGDLLVKNQVAVSRNLSFESMGGSLSLTGIVDAQVADSIEVASAFKLEHVSVDSVFYVFENFNQNFIEARHLKGNATADVTLDFILDKNLKLYNKSLVADISAVIQKGELNNFDPLKKLNKYVDDETLSQLRFADLKNEIHIENKTIYIPQMEIRSNATVMQISGTHTFQQHIDYKIVTPLRNKKVIDIEEAKGAVEEMEGKSKLFLKITGTTDNYRVQYDTEAVKKKIISDLKKEVQELKNTFRNKGKKKEKELELEKEDYFDWEDN